MTSPSQAPVAFTPIPARPAPLLQQGWLGWLRSNLFADWKNGLATFAMLALALWIVPKLFHWAVTGAVFTPDLAACKALAHQSACWGVIAEKYRLIFFGRYPFDEQWRPLAAIALMLALLGLSGWPRLWQARALRPLALAWGIGLMVCWTLMHGGIFGLTAVETHLWGGFPLTLMLSLIGLAAAFPLAILVALGRRSNMPLVRALCVLYIELIRGVPLITVLFMASFLFPLFMPAGLTLDVLIRVQIGIILFSAAYLAEVVRGGLQALPKGQYEAAAALGLSYWQTTRGIVLPQALRLVVPPMVNSLISSFKDTSLVTIVSLYDLTGALRLALGDPNWSGFFIEGYLFIGAIYFVCCFALSRYSRWIEARLRVDVQR